MAYMIYTAHCMLYTEQCILYSAFCLLHPVHFIIYTAHFIVCTEYTDALLVLLKIMHNHTIYMLNNINMNNAQYSW